MATQSHLLNHKGPHPEPGHISVLTSLWQQIAAGFVNRLSPMAGGIIFETADISLDQIKDGLQTYLQVSNIRHTLAGNNVVDYSSPPGQNGRHFANDMFKCIFLNENIWISNMVSLKCVPWGLIDNMAALVQIKALCRPGEPMLTQFTNAYMQH